MIANSIPRIVDSRHPSVLRQMDERAKWRTTYYGGDDFRDTYLEMFSNREDAKGFASRKAVTPIPNFVAAACDEIRNSIFQRMRDIVRRGGSESYQRAVNGLDLGVDRRGSTMNAFMGVKALTELLVMGKVGMFVDAPIVPGASTLADVGDSRPYLYSYQTEDILSWRQSDPQNPSEFQSVLLRDTVLTYDELYFLPTLTMQRYRMMWIDKNDGRVHLQFYDDKGNKIDRDGGPRGESVLELTRIPFVLLDLGDSLIKDVCSHQIALLNLGSSDVYYALKANFPFYVEQRDMKSVGGHLKTAATAEGTASTGGQGAADADIKVGPTQGRAYDKNMNAPAFINPSAEPLKASLELQAKLESDIRKLVNLAVSNLGSRGSAEAKAYDNQGLEAGLSYIGLLLESAERQIGEHWAAYESRDTSQRNVATIKYPDRYSLKTDVDRIDEATKLSALMYKIPGRTVKREIAKTLVLTLLGGKVDVGTIERINNEIDVSKYTTSDPDVIQMAREQGLAGEQVASIALGFEDDEYLQAQKDHLARVERIAKTQGLTPGGSDAAARGVPDLSGDQASAASAEKAASRDNTLRDTTESRVRGDAKNMMGG